MGNDAAFALSAPRPRGEGAKSPKTQGGNTMEQQLAKDVIAITSNPKDVFNIVEEKDGKARWVRIGTAFVNLCCAQHKLTYVVPTFMWRSMDISA